MGMLGEFREFAMKGNVVDMAVGVVIGVSFGKIVSTMVEKVFMPVIGAMTGKLGDISKLQKTISMPGVDPIEIGYGALISAIIDFIIVAFCLFLVVKAMNRMRREAPAEPAAPTTSEVLLMEIRDAVRAK